MLHIAILNSILIHRLVYFYFMLYNKKKAHVFLTEILIAKVSDLQHYFLINFPTPIYNANFIEKMFNFFLRNLKIFFFFKIEVQNFFNM